MPQTLTRRRARAYLTAFIVNDLALLASSSGHPIPTPWGAILENALAPMLVITFLVILARALLREQLFDFDLKLKFAIKGSTLVAIYGAVFLVVEQLAQNLASAQFGVVAGAAAAGLLLFAFRPMQRLAERAADRALPHVRDDDAYRTFKKMEVYKAAFESSIEGGISPKERRMLDALRTKLDIGIGAARALEDDAARAAP
jgi:hypothetical protein